MSKKLVQINVTCTGSTGKIMCSIANEAEKNGYEAYCFYGRGNSKKDVKCIRIESNLSVLFHVFIARVFNKQGHGSYFATLNLIKQLKQIKPDVVHLHNIHGYYLNYKLLFKYLNESNVKVIWTLHDCWALTGHCAYFTMCGCNKWQSACYRCPQIKSYPKSFLLDTSKSEYLEKKKIFTSLKNLTLVTPSKWLSDIVLQSFFKENEVVVINNGINTDVFKPNIDKEIYKKYNIPNDKKIILGVANVWDERKGLNIFFQLLPKINKDFVIVLVGVSKNQMKQIPREIISIERTENVDDLVKIYSIASVFVNPSLEETFSLVTIEAMACGVPVVVCNTSAITELVVENTGIVVNKHSVDDYYKGIIELCKKEKSFYLSTLLEHSARYSNYNKIKEYIDLY